jgi:sulfite exporter TauE/SafE
LSDDEHAPSSTGSAERTRVTTVTGLVLAAAAAGIAGSLHCVAMCGPFAAAAGTPWMIGRLTAYLLAGAVAGALGRSLPHPAWTGWLAALVLLASYLRFGGFIAASEGSGWVVSVARRLPLGGAAGRFLLGGLAALLPCGLLWAGLGIATASRTTWGGMLVMGGFWLGTSPALLAARRLRANAGRWRRPVAATVFLLGLFAIASRTGMAPMPGDGAMCASDAVSRR